MNLYKKILSYLLLSIYVLTSAHGAIPHSHDSNHQHEEHSNEHHAHGHDEHEGNHLIEVTHGIFHSVVHFIENLSHNHNASDEPIIVENTSLSNHIYGASVSCFVPIPLFEYSPKCYDTEAISRYSKLHLVNSSLRGPPSIV